MASGQVSGFEFDSAGSATGIILDDGTRYPSPSEVR